MNGSKIGIPGQQTLCIAFNERSPTDAHAFDLMMMVHQYAVSVTYRIDEKAAGFCPLRKFATAKVDMRTGSTHGSDNLKIARWPIRKVARRLGEPDKVNLMQVGNLTNAGSIVSAVQIRLLLVNRNVQTHAVRNPIRTFDHQSSNILERGHIEQGLQE